MEGKTCVPCHLASTFSLIPQDHAHVLKEIRWELTSLYHSCDCKACPSPVLLMTAPLHIIKTDESYKVYLFKGYLKYVCFRHSLYKNFMKFPYEFLLPKLLEVVSLDVSSFMTVFRTFWPYGFSLQFSFSLKMYIPAYLGTPNFYAILLHRVLCLLYPLDCLLWKMRERT